MRIILVLLLAAGMSPGNVDLLIPQSGSVPVVGWTDNNIPWLMYCEEPAQPVSLGSSCNDISLSLHQASGLDPVLVAITGKLSDWSSSAEIRKVTISDLSQAAYCELVAPDFTPPPGECSFIHMPVLPRYVDCDADRRAFIVLNTGYTDGLVQNEAWMTTIPVHPWSTPLVEPSDASVWKQCYYENSVGLSGQIPEGTLPMFSPATCVSWIEMGYDYYSVCSFSMNSDTLECTDFYVVNTSDPAIPPEVLSSGYSETDQIALWNDTSGTVWCGSFTTSATQPVNTQLSVPHSELPFASALTRTRGDQGLALAWYDGANIMIRHWDGEWSGYSHTVEPWSHVSPGNIAVCSDQDGYWVAWKDDTELMPEYRFISRETITGIQESESSSGGGIVIAVGDNPVAGITSYLVSLPVAESYGLYLYDLSGRNIQEITHGFSIRDEGVLDLSGYPPGVYSLVLRTDGGTASVRILKAGN